MVGCAALRILTIPSNLVHALVLAFAQLDLLPLYFPFALFTAHTSTYPRWLQRPAPAYSSGSVAASSVATRTGQLTTKDGPPVSRSGAPRRAQLSHRIASRRSFQSRSRNSHCILEHCRLSLLSFPGCWSLGVPCKTRANTVALFSLFHAPVESDIAYKPAPKNPADPANARSPIRRAERRRQLLETRTHRLQLLHALQSNTSDANDAALSEPMPSEPRSRPSETMRGNSNEARRYDLWNNINADFDDDSFAWVYPGARTDGPPTTSLPGPEALIAGEGYAGLDYSRPLGSVDLDSRLLADYRRSTQRESSAPRRSVSIDPPSSRDLHSRPLQRLMRS